MRGRIRVAAPGCAIAAIAAATLAACSGPGIAAVPLPPVDSPPAVGAALLPFYDQELVWEDCPSAGGARRECATVLAPLDYDHPARATVELALMRAPVRDADTRLGSVVINPGGPGRSAIEALEPALAALGNAVTAAFDVVAVDPRGVGRSTPVDCIGDADLDVWRAGASTVADRDRPDERAGDARRLVESCDAGAGQVLAHVDTVSAARDLDVVRGALGDDRLSFVGQSYGTELGATYAHLFPLRVGRMILDAGLDPAMDHVERRLGLAAGLESALAAYAGDCAARPACPLAEDADAAVAQVRELLAALSRAPLPTDGARPLTRSLTVEALAAGVVEERTWLRLDGALAAALDGGDGTRLLAMADQAAGRDGAGVYASPTVAAHAAVTCLDSARRVGEGDLPDVLRAFERASPTFGRLMLDAALMCDAWPARPAGGDEPLHWTGASPMVVLGRVDDPVAPHAWSVALAEQLEPAVHVSVEGRGHTSVGRGDRCVTAVVDALLLAGTMPADGSWCAAGAERPATASSTGRP